MSVSSENEPTVRRRSDLPFHATMWGLSSFYVVLILLMLIAAATQTTLTDLLEAFQQPALRHSFWLTMASSTLATLLALLTTVPLAYLTSQPRSRRAGQTKGRQTHRQSKLLRLLLNLLLDVPNVLPPLVLGLLLLMLFSSWPLASMQGVVVYQPVAIVIAQFVVASSFALPAIKNSFDKIDPRLEEIAQTLGCSRGGAFWRATMPEAWRAVLTTGALAWARCLGCFGPILVFAGTTRNKTEVLSTSIYLELMVGDIRAAVAIAMLMIALAIGIVGVARWFASHREEGPNA